LETTAPNARESIAVVAIAGVETTGECQGLPSTATRVARDRRGAVARDRLRAPAKTGEMQRMKVDSPSKCHFAFTESHPHVNV
jgi:hypothetical protein